MREHAPIIISLLGTPVVSLDGEPLAIPRRQVRALLYRLAGEIKPLSRSYLGYLFWADCKEREARQNLSRLLVYLGKALPFCGMILADETHVQLAREHLSVDTCAFDRCREAWKTSGSYRELQAATDLYRGPFLDGFYLPGNAEYNNWIQDQAEFWQQCYLKSLAELVEKSSQWNDLNLSIEYANRYLEHNDLAEDIHRKLIELHTARGDRSAAVRQYERCAAVLERELGVRPSPETQAAYQSAIKQEAMPLTPPIPVPVWSVLPSLLLPLIGRQDALAELDSHLSRIRMGGGGIVLILGEPGIGKSRLMKEFSSQPRLKTRVLAGSSAAGSRIPFQPLVEAIRPALDTPGIISQIPAQWISEAARLFPELIQSNSLINPLPEQHSTEEARGRLFEALLRIITGLTTGGYTLLLCLDDLQWADASTLDWLVYLHRRISDQRILVLGSCRTEKNDSLTRLRRTLSRQENYHELALDGLSSKDICRLVNSLDAIHELDDIQVERLCQSTGGNPFFLLETLRMMIDSGQIPGQDLSAGQFPLPDTVQAAVAARLDRLHPRVRQVLEAASVLGAAFRFEAVHLTSGREELEILDGLDELIARQFLVEMPSGYAFCHTITRDAVYAGMSMWRRKRLHHRAGSALERLGSDDWVSLAWHFEQAGKPGKAADYALRAGQAARAVFAHTEARASYERALVLLNQELVGLKDTSAVEANHRKRIQLLYERGWALRLLGEMDAYTRDLEEVASLAKKLNDPDALAHLRWQEAYNHRWFCRYEAARSAARQGLKLSQESGNKRLSALCQRELGMAARETGDYELARNALERALDQFKLLGDEAIYTLHTLGNLSTLYCRLGDGEQALECARQAMDLCEHLSLPYERRLPLGDMGAAESMLGSLECARRCLQESLTIARQVADRTQVIFCLGHLGFLEISQGNYPSAHQYLLEALDLAELIGSLTEQSWLHLGLAQAHAGLGEPDLALIYAAKAQVIARKHSRLPDECAAQELFDQLHQLDSSI